MINILFSGNEKVFDGMLTCMLSIFKRTQTTEPFHFYILTARIYGGYTRTGSLSGTGGKRISSG